MDAFILPDFAGYSLSNTFPATVHELVPAYVSLERRASSVAAGIAAPARHDRHLVTSAISCL